MSKPRLCFVVESGADVRLVDELADRFALTILARRIIGGSEISQPTRRATDVRVGPSSRLAFAWVAWKHLTSTRYDTVLVQGYALAALIANIVGSLRGVRTFMLVCSPIEQYYRCRARVAGSVNRFRSWEYIALRSLARLNAIIGQDYVVLSDYLADVVRSHRTRSPVHVIPVYGVDTMVFAPTTEPSAAIRERISLPAEGSLLFFSSRVAPEKDSSTLLVAFRSLLESGRQVWLLHRSGGYRELLNQAHQLGVVDRIIATDAKYPDEHLALDYQASDVCIQASKEEGLGFSALEALACGVPVIAAAVGGLRDTIKDGVTGCTYPVGDAASLARCITSVLDNTREARRRALVGRQLVVDRYERHLVFDRLESLLNEG